MNSRKMACTTIQLSFSPGNHNLLKSNWVQKHRFTLYLLSDNGGNTRNGGASNLPLKGQKGTYYEGGVRVPAFVHSPRYVENPGYVMIIFIITHNSRS